MPSKGSDEVIELKRKWSSRVDGEINAFPGQDGRSLKIWGDFVKKQHAVDEEFHASRQRQGYPHSTGRPPALPGSAQRVYGCGPITSIGYDSDGAGFVLGPEHVPPKYKYTGMNWNVPKKLTQIETGMRTSLGHEAPREPGLRRIRSHPAGMHRDARKMLNGIDKMLDESRAPNETLVLARATAWLPKLH